MAITSKASFKNSRVQPRAATQEAKVFRVSVLTTPPNTLLIAPNANRTYVTLRNENATLGEDIRYDYTDNVDILTEGFLLKGGEAVDLETKGSIFARAVPVGVEMSVDE